MVGTIDNDDGMVCLTDEDRVRTEREHHAYSVYKNLLESFGLMDFENLNNQNVSPVGKFTLTSDDYPDHYGGAYIGDNGDLVIHTPIDVSRSKETIQDIVRTSQFSLKQSPYSYKRLLQIKEGIRQFHLENTENPICMNITAYGISDYDNNVFVEMELLHDEQIVLFKERISDFPGIVFKQGGRAVPFATVQPHEVVTKNSGVSESTVGYRANAVGIEGFIMSGHAARAKNQVIKLVNGTEVGTVIGWQNSGSVDAAFVQAKSSVTLSNVVKGTTTTLSSSIATPVSKASFYFAGMIAGIKNGTIGAIDVDMKVGGVPLTNLFASAIITKPGDSGGPCYTTSGSSRNIFGINVGSNDHFSVFCKASNIVESFRATPF